MNSFIEAMNMARRAQRMIDRLENSSSLDWYRFQRHYLLQSCMIYRSKKKRKKLLHSQKRLVQIRDRLKIESVSAIN